MLLLFLGIVMLICVAMCWNEGLWGNAITLINVVLAAMIATNYFEPLASLIDSQMPSYTYLWDFLSIWLLFAFVYAVLRAVSDNISKVKVRFKMPVEQAGRIILALAIGYVMMAFTAMTLHTAPLAQTAFRGSFGQVQKGVLVEKASPNYGLFGTSPDRQWLGFMNYASGESGPLSRWALFGWQKRPFDPKAYFIFKYAARRQKLEQHNRETGTMRVRTD
jgi:hypothetical protein